MSMQESNLYRALRAVLPEPVLLAGTVTAVHTADGMVTVQYPGGGTQRVRGTASVSDEVWVKDGELRGPAPALIPVTIEI